MDPERAPKRKRSTRTSAFGTRGRISHDASRFYSSRLYLDLDNGQPVEYSENPIPAHALDRVLCKSSQHMDELPDRSVHLMVTSPPYNASKEYDEDLSLEEYLRMLAEVWQETYRVLVPGGRACINVANLGRKPYIPLHSYVIEAMLGLGFLMRGEIIWDKGGSSSTSTAWGSWKSASNPVLRDVHEYILVFCKGSFQRPRQGRENTISREEFLEWTRSVWGFPPESARRVGHPAPFPEELPYRLTQLYTYQGEVVLDPFMGSGSTALAARRAGRHFVGYETSAEYVALAERRLREGEGM
jgi:DNA modification methylase